MHEKDKAALIGALDVMLCKFFIKISKFVISFISV